MLAFVPVASGTSHPLRLGWDAVQPDVVRVASAFGTESGADVLRQDILDKDRFDAEDKRWLMGIQDGVTQPEGLRRLQSFRRSQVRVPFGSAVLASPTLRAPTFFHSKLYCFENSRSGELQLLSSSANLTYRGLRTNVEQFLAWSGSRTDPTARAFIAWWDDLWSAADVATSAFVDAYEAARPTLPTPPTAATTGPPAQVLQTARSFWIELTRRPEGGSLNQVELLFNGHFFFYPGTANPPVHTHRRLTFEDDAGMHYANAHRQIMFNGPPRKPGGNHMWRVYMPTAHEGLTAIRTVTFSSASSARVPPITSRSR